MRTFLMMMIVGALSIGQAVSAGKTQSPEADPSKDQAKTLKALRHMQGAPLKGDCTDVCTAEQCGMPANIALRNACGNTCDIAAGTNCKQAIKALPLQLLLNSMSKGLRKHAEQILSEEGKQDIKKRSSLCDKRCNRVNCKVDVHFGHFCVTHCPENTVKNCTAKSWADSKG